jgi:hypothetical protein
MYRYQALMDSVSQTRESLVEVRDRKEGRRIGKAVPVFSSTSPVFSSMTGSSSLTSWFLGCGARPHPVLVNSHTRMSMVDGSQRISLPDEGRWYVPPFCDMGKIRRCQYPLWSKTQSKVPDYRDMSKAAGRREDTTQPPMYIPGSLSGKKSHTEQPKQLVSPAKILIAL